MGSILKTERLILRQFEFSDAGFIMELVNSPGWLEFIGDRNIRTEEDSIQYLQRGPMKSYQENGFGLSMVTTKEGTPIGMCGILKRENFEHPDIGFAFLPEFMGKGYAFEIAEATLKYAKTELNLDPILAITMPTNKKSIRLLEKIGLKFKKIMYAPDKNEELMLFSSQ